MPFIDSFQSCYKVRLRFFAGLYFVYRVVLLGAFSLSPNGLLFDIYAEVILVVILGIHAIVQPYKKQIHNIIDSLIFLNLALINGCAIIIKEWIKEYDDPYSYTQDTNILLMNAFQLVLLYIPMVAMLVYLARQGCIYVKRKRSTRSVVREVTDVLNQDCGDDANLMACEESTKILLERGEAMKADLGSTRTCSLPGGGGHGSTKTLERGGETRKVDYGSTKTLERGGEAIKLDYGSTKTHSLQGRGGEAKNQARLWQHKDT